MLPITIVSATRYDQQSFYLQSALGQCLSQTYPNFPVKSKIYFQNRKPLPTCYNDALATTANPEEMMIFIHDDVFILDFFWTDKILFGGERFDIMGVVGNKRRMPRQPSWALDEKLNWDQLSNLSGMVAMGQQFPCPLAVFGPSGQPCKLLDGLLLVTKKSTLKINNICFDEQFDFDFYDLDLCRQAELKNLRIGTIPLSVVHQSRGNVVSPRWKKNYENYLVKWKE